MNTEYESVGTIIEIILAWPNADSNSNVWRHFLSREVYFTTFVYVKQVTDPRMKTYIGKYELSEPLLSLNVLMNECIDKTHVMQWLSQETGPCSMNIFMKYLMNK